MWLGSLLVMVSLAVVSNLSRSNGLIAPSSTRSPGMTIALSARWNHDDDDNNNNNTQQLPASKLWLSSPPSSPLSRDRFGRWMLLSASSVVPGAFLVGDFVEPSPACAFDGGVGGLGKTKPSTGVQFFDTDGYSAPMQNSKGIVSAEIKSLDNAKPILVQFQTPWPLLPTTSGLEARDLQTSESAFIQVVPAVRDWQERKVFLQLLMETVLASQGKFGAYGSPTDIKVKPIVKKNDTADGTFHGFSVTFTSYTPGMRESERQVWIVPKQVDKDTLVMIIVGTTRARFPSQEATVQKIADSFQATAAPQSKLR